MLKTRRVRIILYAFLAFLVLAAAALVFFPFAPDEDDVLRLMDETLSAQSYRYQMVATVTTDGVERAYFDLSGSKSGDAAELSGTVLGTETALVFLEGMLYQQVDGKWQSHQVADIASAAELFAELMPEQAFAHGELASFEYLGSGEVQGKKVRQAILNAPAAGWVGEYFFSPLYTVNMESSGNRLHSLQLSAFAKQNENSKLSVTVSFSDLNENISIEAPLQ